MDTFYILLHGLRNLLLPMVIAVLGGRSAKGQALYPFQICHLKTKNRTRRRRPGFKHAPALVQTSKLRFVFVLFFPLLETCFQGSQELVGFKSQTPRVNMARFIGLVLSWHVSRSVDFGLVLHNSSWNYRKGWNERGLVCCLRYVVSSFVRAAISARQWRSACML